MKSARAFAHRYLAKAFPVSLENGLLTIGFDDKSAEYIPLVDSAKTHGIVTKLLAEQGHPGCRIAFTETHRPTAESAQAAVPGNTTKAQAALAESAAKDEADTPATPATAADPLVDFDPAKFKEDPEIREALEVFKARIVQVIPPGDKADSK
jgi:hypothetical protein